LKFPDRIRAIVSEVRQSLPPEIPLSAKLRLGWDDPSAIHLNAEMAAEGGASWITIHGRTRLQGYIPPAYWEPIGEVRKRLKIPVVANGEIWTLDDFKRCRDETQSEHFMLGRGALANPLLPLEIARELGILDQSGNAAQFQLNWGDLIQRFIEFGIEYTRRPGYLPSRIKQWVRMAHQRTPLSWYDTVKTLQDLDEILKTIQGVRV
jgi:tRNA-dihydrouridine synthase C